MEGWIDISQSLAAERVAWPGDVPFSRAWTLRTQRGDSVNCSAIRQSVHVGTHADAPYHVDASGATTDAWSLPQFLGRADVVAIPAGASTVAPEHLTGCTTARILLKTLCSSRPTTTWNGAFPAVSVDAVSWMESHDVQLVGTDAPSVDPATSTTLKAHHALNAAGIVNLENLRLGHVAPGTYTLVALPLRIAGSDAAPVRAVLHPNPNLLA